MRICFIISSYIFCDDKPFYAEVTSNRSVFSAEERIAQTYRTIETVKEKVPGAYIILADNSKSNPKQFFEDKVDKFIYLGDKKFARKAASSKSKSFGESVLMINTLPYAKKFEYVFKLSGRYFLDDRFDLNAWDFGKICFLHNTEEYEKLPQNGGYCYGSHNMVMYAFPKKYYGRMYRAFWLSIPFIQKTRPIETALPYFCRKPIHYMKTLGASGLMAGNGELWSR